MPSISSVVVDRYRKGQRAERLAAWHLRARGWRVLTQRYKTPVGEVDLIARRGTTLVFVEVKARDTAVIAVEAITPKAKARIRRAAEHFTMRGAAASTLRFDVIAVIPRSRSWLPPKCVHIENAF